MRDQRIRLTLAVAVASALAGCDGGGDDDSKAAAPQTEQPAEPPRAEQAPASGQTQGQPAPAPEPSEPGAPAGPGADKGAAMKQKLEAMKKQKRMRDEAITAAEEAEGKGDSRCSKAFHAAVAMGDSLREQQGMQREGEPDEEAFVAACQKLPDQLQRCMLPSYGADNAQQCRQAHQEADPQTQQALQAMMAQAQ